jgi:hypothetical protein
VALAGHLRRGTGPDGDHAGGAGAARSELRRSRRRAPLLGGGALLDQGVLLFGLGAALYLVPSVQSVLWPWPLTPLTARAVAAWLVAFGLGAVLASRANDLRRMEISAWSYGLMAVLELVVGIRHMDLIRWTEPSAWGICHCWPWCWPPMWRGSGKSEAEQGRHL